MPRVPSFRCCSRSECLPRWPPPTSVENRQKSRALTSLKGQLEFIWPDDSPQLFNNIHTVNETTDAGTSVGRRTY
jgi:hypothetical protein